MKLHPILVVFVLLSLTDCKRYDPNPSIDHVVYSDGTKILKSDPCLNIRTDNDFLKLEPMEQRRCLEINRAHCGYWTSKGSISSCLTRKRYKYSLLSINGLTYHQHMYLTLLLIVASIVLTYFILKTLNIIRLKIFKKKP
jgi:hypothetical protein